MFMLKLSHHLCYKHCPYQQYDVCSVQCWCTVHWTLQHRLRLSSTEDARPMPPPIFLSYLLLEFDNFDCENVRIAKLTLKSSIIESFW